jgi:hypothetical protein
VSRQVHQQFSNTCPVGGLWSTKRSKDALSGTAERPIAADVVSLARRIGPGLVRGLDAIHLAAAILIDSDVVLTYDDRHAPARAIDRYAPMPGGLAVQAAQNTGGIGPWAGISVLTAYAGAAMLVAAVLFVTRDA